MYTINDNFPSIFREALSWIFRKAVQNYDVCDIYKYKSMAKSWGRENYIDKGFWLQVPIGFSLGSGTSIGRDFRVYGSGSLVIGNRCQISSCCTVITSRYNHSKRGPISRDGEESNVNLIGDDCWLGHGVTILPGVKIGDRAIVGSSVTVTKSIPDDSIVTTRIAYRRITRIYD